MSIIKNTAPFYSSDVSRQELFQGDILNARKLKLKTDSTEVYEPDFWMVITKTCDLQISDGNLRGKSVGLVALISRKLISCLMKKKLEDELSGIKNRVVVAAVHKLFKVYQDYHKASDIDSLIKGQISRFFFLPANNKELTEPMFIDFELIEVLPALDNGSAKFFLDAKTAQLNTPFRERVAQKFGLHYSSIGIEDDEIRDKQFAKDLKKGFV